MWGECTNKSYWQALREEPQFVPANERRAVCLLGKVCDPRRVAMFLDTGLLFARGNVTGRTYCLVHGAGHGVGLYELNDGRVPTYWCTVPGDSKCPPTDHIVTLKNLIEGEEMYVRQIGNNHGSREFSPDNEGLLLEFFGIHNRDPHLIGFWDSATAGFMKSVSTFSWKDPFDAKALDLLHYRDVFFESPLPQGTGPAHYRDYRYPHGNEIILGTRGDGFELEPLTLTHVDYADPLAMYEAGIGAEREPVGYPGPRLDDHNAVRRFGQANALAGNDPPVMDDFPLAECPGVAYLQGFVDGTAALGPRQLLGDNLHGLAPRNGFMVRGGVDADGGLVLPGELAQLRLKPSDVKKYLQDRPGCRSPLIVESDFCVQKIEDFIGSIGDALEARTKQLEILLDFEL